MMPVAPNRGSRACASCLHFTDKRSEWDRDCKLDACECKAQRKEFGRALCEHYKTRVYVDTSGKNLSGPAAGYCEWKCPPILKDILWGKWGDRLVADTDWCHCYEPIPAVKPIISAPGQRAILHADASALPSNNSQTIEGTADNA